MAAPRELKMAAVRRAKVKAVEVGAPVKTKSTLLRRA
jgi:hypothetical protein